jgi:uncharacterized membrane protein YedE/YeeE
MTSLSPVATGAGLGALDALAFATADRGLGITTAFENAAALAGRRLLPRATAAYLTGRDEPPRLDWESFLVLGVLAGSHLAARLAGERTREAVPPLWAERFGPSPAKRYAGAFAGGALMMVGARMAKGCTSGHALTGTMQGALSSWVFSPLMFASAALAARVLYGRRAT